MKSVRLRFNYEFSRVYRRGRYATGRVLTVHAFKRPEGLKHNNILIDPDAVRVGFCANKKQLGAVGRNRIRRLLRESYRQLESEIPTGYDLVFTMRSLDEIPSYWDIVKEMTALLKRLHLISKAGEAEA